MGGCYQRTWKASKGAVSDGRGVVFIFTARAGGFILCREGPSFYSVACGLFVYERNKGYESML